MQRRRIDDKMPTLWQTYAQHGDSTLVKYANNLHTKYFYGELPADFYHVELMRRMKAKFDYIVSRGPYGGLSPERNRYSLLRLNRDTCHARHYAS